MECEGGGPASVRRVWRMRRIRAERRVEVGVRGRRVGVGRGVRIWRRSWRG